MFSSLTLSLLLLAALIPTAGPAQTSPPPVTIAALPAGFSFDGAWTCEGTFRNGKAHRAAYDGSVAIGGKWLQLRERDVEPATGYLATYLIGYDAQAHGLVEFDANNFSAAVYRSATGWQSGALTLVSAVNTDAKAPYAQDRFTYTAHESGQFTVDWQVQRAADQPWVTADHLTCKR